MLSDKAAFLKLGCFRNRRSSERVYRVLSDGRGSLALNPKLIWAKSTAQYRTTIAQMRKHEFDIFSLPVRRKHFRTCTFQAALLFIRFGPVTFAEVDDVWIDTIKMGEKNALTKVNSVCQNDVETK